MRRERRQLTRGFPRLHRQSPRFPGFTRVFGRPQLAVDHRISDLRIFRIEAHDASALDARRRPKGRPRHGRLEDFVFLKGLAGLGFRSCHRLAVLPGFQSSHALAQYKQPPLLALPQWLRRVDMIAGTYLSQFLCASELLC